MKFINEEGMEKKLPPNSKNARYYCKGCGDYVAEDATRPLGVMGLPLHLVKVPSPSPEP